MDTKPSKGSIRIKAKLDSFTMFQLKPKEETKIKKVHVSVVTKPTSPSKGTPDKGSFGQGAKSLDFEELVTHRYESFDRDIKALSSSLEDYHAAMVHQRKMRVKAFDDLKQFSKDTPLADTLRNVRPSITAINRKMDKTSDQYDQLFEEKIIDYINEWKDIVSHKYENEMKEFKDYKTETLKRQQKVKQLQSHYEKMLSTNREKADNEAPRLKRKEAKLDAAAYQYEKHKKALTHIIDELIDGSWKDLYPLMANLLQLEMDSSSEKAKILADFRISIDRISNITQQEGSTTSSNTTMWRSLRTDWLNAGPTPTVPSPEQLKPLAPKNIQSAPTERQAATRVEKEEREEKLPAIVENAMAERDESPAMTKKDEPRATEENYKPPVMPNKDEPRATAETYYPADNYQHPVMPKIDESPTKEENYLSSPTTKNYESTPMAEHQSPPMAENDRPSTMAENEEPPKADGQEESRNEGLVGAITSLFRPKPSEPDTPQTDQPVDSVTTSVIDPLDPLDMEAAGPLTVVPIESPPGQPADSQNEQQQSVLV